MSTLTTLASTLAAEFRAVGIYRSQDGGGDFPQQDEQGNYTSTVCVYANNSLRALGLPRYPLENTLHRHGQSQGYAGVIDWLNNTTDEQVLVILDALS